MNRTRVILVGGLIVLIAVFAVEGQRIRAASTDGPSQTASGKSPAAGRSGGGPPVSSGPIAVVTAVAASRDVPITETSVGWVEPVAIVDVRPRIDGTIVARPVTDGQTVKSGDLLFRLDDMALEAALAKDQATLAKDQASAEQLQADLARLKKLRTNDYATEQQVEEQQASLDEANASILADKAQIQSDQVSIGYTSITAPIAGRIGVISASEGNLVRAADTAPLLTITQMAPLRVSFAIPERDLDSFREAVTANPPAAVRALDPDTGKLLSSGQLDFIDSMVDASSGTVTVKADFDNADGRLWPGQYVRVEADLGVERGATVVPMAAVQLNEKGSYVFVVKQDGTVAAQPVTVGHASGDSAVIQSGLRPNDHVVVEGQLRLRNGARIEEKVAAAEPDDAIGGGASLNAP